MSDCRCGCCEGVEVLTPLSTANRPGLPALSYRVGTHSSFLESMVARVSGHRLADGRRPLDRLTTRAPDDPAIALLDAWATVADVLTFYQERIANEGYLLTATERRSVLELARLVGYRLRPGVAASVYLAFTLEDGFDGEVPEGTRARSVPGPGELPQPFETSEALAARARWNAIPARLTRPQLIRPVAFDGTRAFFAEGVRTALEANDTVAVVCGTGSQRRAWAVRAVEPDAAAGRTRVAYALYGEPAAPLANDDRDERDEGARAPALTRLDELVDALLKAPAHRPASRFELARAPGRAYAITGDLGPRLLTAFHPRLEETLYTAYANAPVAHDPQVGACAVHAMRVDAAPFGHNAPKELVYERNVLTGRREWPLMELGATARVRLDSTDDDRRLVAALGGHWDLAELVNPLSISVALDRGDGAFAFASTVTAGELIDRTQPPFGQSDPSFSRVFELDSDGGRSVEITLAYSGPFDDATGAYDDAELESLTVRFLVEGFRGTSIGIDLPGPVVELVSAPADPSDRLRVSIDRDPARIVAPGEPIEATVASRSVSVAFDAGLTVQHRTPELATREQLRTVTLDADYDGIAAGGWAVVARDGRSAAVHRVEAVRTVSRADYGMSGRFTQLVLDAPWLDRSDTSLGDIRAAAIHARSERLDLAEEPIETDVSGRELELDGLYDGLEAGRWLVVAGERTDVKDADGRAVEGVAGRELVMLAGVRHDVLTFVDASGVERELPGDTLHTRLVLSDPLAYTYARDTVTVNANVVHATHGERVEEVLGSGNPTQAFQEFTLKKPPLTHVSAPTPDGIESTLEVRVDRVRWPEQETLLHLEGRERGYATATDDDGVTRVVFGDGRYGARPPTGVENVTAVYRSGIGRGGNVEAGAISLLATRPLGVKEVLNPQSATGGADPESRDQGRENAPLAVLALDRLVSVSDYGAFARRFAGVGKAEAVRLTDGRRQVVHLTVAGADDVAVEVGSDLHGNLTAAVARFGDPAVPLCVAPREAVFVFLVARVKVHEDHLWKDVEPKLRGALLATLGFARRALGQDVLLSEVVQTMHGVAGVEWVDVDLLDGVAERDALDPDVLAERLAALAAAAGGSAPSSGGSGRPGPRRRLVADTARVDATATGACARLRPAQLAYLNPDLPDTLILTEVAS